MKDELIILHSLVNGEKFPVGIIAKNASRFIPVSLLVKIREFRSELRDGNNTVVFIEDNRIPVVETIEEINRLINGGQPC